MPSNFHRPGSDYIPESRQNNEKYQLLTQAKRPITDILLDQDIGYLIDISNGLSDRIDGVSLGDLPGVADPTNFGKFLTPDGAGSSTWAFVSSVNVLDSSLTGSKLFPQTITQRELADGGIPASKIQLKTITSGLLADECVTTEIIEDGAVTKEKIGAGAVTSDEIADSAVRAAELAVDAVTTVKILDANVTTAKIADANITTAKILDANITTPKLADGAITLPKLGGDVTATIKVAATKAEQIAGASNNVYTSPAVQQFHPSSVKAHLMWAEGATLEFYNCTINMGAPGVFTVTFTVPFSSNNYSVGGSVGTGAGGEVLAFSTLTNATRLAGSIQINVYKSSLGLAGGTFQPSVLDLQFYGQQ